ncbi:INO80 chromatin remodeling complex subunit [Komagataella phaffii CBS 7435]|uniref:INO80 complex subunit B-like conserved region domain-containing protein n=2 Tax=Komagataella phaffii TaxID=460519 RepID=C4QZG2_KOMPG|nr:Hypothetical protein PAS_chr2-1_0036 [Komagataella phaffii GS115]AOA62638.1 GQ67_00060T0 [Komagataella phaffii]CAH2448869.1 INO80 chromatin remodeling complex subunit [Komagataella phaffii CBS 7435]AOA67877.1 GQ68_01327T0 [Komagataella phaffii GS115]CAY68636.1 Hypothetical protein PAS_chr2-1_0036 [Komagataella phaffii GS115]CCA38946.1 INO80 chromatin remodeling complex subunit [Komagataella phaffii CBS 7435]
MSSEDISELSEISDGNISSRSDEELEDEIQENGYTPFEEDDDYGHDEDDDDDDNIHDQDQDDYLDSSTQPETVDSEITSQPRSKQNSLVVKLQPRRAKTRLSYNESDDEFPEDEELDEEEEVEEEDDDDDDNFETPQLGEPTDVSKMTERQRAKFLEQEEPQSFLELPTNKKKKELTEEEILLKREENSRKRKNFNERRLEEEKRDTLNKLLKKRASKVRSKKSLDEFDDDENEVSKRLNRPRRPQLVHPALSRWTCTSKDEQVIIRYGIPGTSK